MPGLPFQNLPATQQDPMNILQSRLGQSEQYLKSQYDTELGGLQNQMLADKDFFNQLNQLNSKYQGALNQERYRVDQQVQSIKRIQTLVNSGQIAPDAGQEAMWRMVLPSETERAMFQAAGRQQQPYSIGQITSEAVMTSIQDFAEAASDKPGIEWGPPKKLQPGLTDQYLEWRRLIGYDALNPLRQRQLDMQWDAFMAGDEKFNAWWSDKEKREPLAEIRAFRTPGKIGKIMQKRITGVGRVTPFGQSVARGKRSAISRMALPMSEEEIRGAYGFKPKAAQQPKRLPQPTTQIEYNTLPSGTQYMGSDGQIRTKR